MTARRNMNRWLLARRLQDVALRISAGKPIRIGGVWVRLPDRMVLEEEFETKKGVSELEFEIKWPTAKGRLPKKRQRVSSPKH